MCSAKTDQFILFPISNSWQMMGFCKPDVCVIRALRGSCSCFQVPSSGLAIFQVASDRPCCVSAHTDSRLSATQAAQWDVPAKRAAIVPVRELLFSGEIYSCLKQPAFFLLSRLHHGHANKVLNVRQKPKNRRFFLFFSFFLHVEAWPWTLLHAEVMTTQSAGVSLACTQGQTRALKSLIIIRV